MLLYYIDKSQQSVCVCVSAAKKAFQNHTRERTHFARAVKSCETGSLIGGLRLTSGADGAGEPDALPRHPEAEEPGPPVPERIIPRRLVGGCACEDESWSKICRQLRAGRRPLAESGHGRRHSHSNPHSAVGRRQSHVTRPQLSHHQRLRGRTPHVNFCLPFSAGFLAIRLIGLISKQDTIPLKINQ